MELLEITEPVARLSVIFRSCRKWQGVRYLGYHSVVDADQPPPGDSFFTVTAKSFRRHLEIIRASGIKVISFPESLKMLEAGTVRGRHIVITFDDGYLDNYTVAWPILKEFVFSAHFFIVADRIGITFRDGKEKQDDDTDKMCMDIEKLKLLKAQGATIGSHSTAHRPLTSFTDKEVMRELSYSKSRLEEILNVLIDTFAYPHAAYNSRVIKAVRNVGYRYAFGIGMGHARKLCHTNRFSILRNVVSDSISLDQFDLIIKGGYDWSQSYHRLKHYLKYRRL